MILKSEKQQLMEKVQDVEISLSWQSYEVKLARKKYERKACWIFSFWIVDNLDTLNYNYKKEVQIQENLEEYLSHLNRDIDNLIKQKI